MCLLWRLALVACFPNPPMRLPPLPCVFPPQSWVLKYADAIVKNFAGSAVMAILVVISVYWFGLHTTLITWVGVGMVLVITWTYMTIALKLPKEG